MAAWIELDDAERIAVWDRFYEAFAFRPSVYAKDWPGIKEPIPSRTYRDNDIWRSLGEEVFAERMIAAFRQCLAVPERLYVLDWHHDCYWFDPHQPFAAIEAGEWPIPLLPNGDYYIYLAHDFRFGTFGHPWEKTFCIFGQPLLDAFDASLPTSPLTPVRVDGQPLP